MNERGFKMEIIAGIIMSIGGILLKIFTRYFEKNILIKWSEKEQKEYWEKENRLSEMGAYNVPFKDGKLIATKNNNQTFYTFIIGLGIALIIIGIIF
jgi:Tfp pilus assembly major pilin PilA